MKLLLFSGSHPRHLFVHKSIIDLGFDYHAIVMEREELLPTPPRDIHESDIKIFNKHFEDRYKVEKDAYQEIEITDVFQSDKLTVVSPEDLNSKAVLNLIMADKFDMSFIFGPDMIKEPILSNLPQVKMNLHLGLSPWYKGSATLFWPFYFLQPQYAGITLHNISEKPDQGDIFHQSTPKLSLGDGIHDVAAKAVIQAREDVIKMVLKFNKKGQLKFTQQRTTGRVWRTIDFQPAHLRVIYNLFNNDIVDYYLNGVFPEDLPKLISRLEDE